MLTKSMIDTGKYRRREAMQLAVSAAFIAVAVTIGAASFVRWAARPDASRTYLESTLPTCSVGEQLQWSGDAWSCSANAPALPVYSGPSLITATTGNTLVNAGPTKISPFSAISVTGRSGQLRWQCSDGSWHDVVLDDGQSTILLWDGDCLRDFLP